jgi:hypothetical protein
MKRVLPSICDSASEGSRGVEIAGRFFCLYHFTKEMGFWKTVVANYAQDKLKIEIAGNTTRHYSTLSSRKDRPRSESGFSL